ncbi:ketohydroxyglutarate aldolase [Companilactobacillus halodurans]|uniref:Ketohydroxyglutarate aldolase n=1 Tax=Companilactobacillus halodurans TaxID=2584183 RepID=A0A5P0ZXQ4_9LACO|nr:ketohydroxyglutarate aldolase [Companilactobacillus halodurans]MQS75158.1 ketohydroxyglutarate aldolase [Companilactobacillus halodurans]MQS97578.1 ketohydroxyglutarate aldolase [Companilactobacillus halodurans]
MKKLDYMNRIYDSGALAVVRADTKRVLEIAEGIVKGGVDVMEVSYTIDSAADSIIILRKKFGDKLLVGAGTVLDGETAKDAIKSGAQFIYSPMFDKEVARLCNQYQIPYAPGCTSVTEAVNALREGATFIKIFPYGGIVGPDLIKTIKTPIPYLPLIESGGVNTENIIDWLKAGTDIVGIGGALSKGNIDDIADNAKQFRNKIDEYRKQK